MKKHIILFIAIFFASVLHAQTINIRGTVTDTSNETLPGVSITCLLYTSDAADE